MLPLSPAPASCRLLWCGVDRFNPKPASDAIISRDSVESNPEQIFEG